MNTRAASCDSGKRRKNASKRNSNRKRFGSFSMRGAGYNGRAVGEQSMLKSAPSALVTDNGRRVLFRIERRFYELPQEELRSLLELPPGPAGLGVTIDRERFYFEFAGDNQRAEISAKQLHRRLIKLAT